MRLPHGHAAIAGCAIKVKQAPISSHRALTHLAARCRMPEARDEDGEEALLEDQVAWIQGVPSFAARRAKGKHPNPQHEDPRLEKLQRDLLLVEKALPREALPGEAPPTSASCQLDTDLPSSCSWRQPP